MGSTLGGPRVLTAVNANGSIEKIYASDCGETLVGSVILRHHDATTGLYLAQERPGQIFIRPYCQEHRYTLTNGIEVYETIFALRTTGGEDEKVDPPAVYEMVELRNPDTTEIEIVTYAFAVLRGDTRHDVEVVYDRRAKAMVAWNRSNPELARVFGCSKPPASFEATLDFGKAVSTQMSSRLSGETDARADPLGVLQHVHRLKPGQIVRFAYLISYGHGKSDALKNYRAAPPAGEALKRTAAFFEDYLSRSVILTPDANVNRGVLWAKANMLRIQTKAPTGWCFVNDPMRSNNSVGRDTAWFGFGADYLDPDFVRKSLEAYVERQERRGLIVEYYDIRTGKTEDYGLNVNDNTPLLLMALWHHYNATGDIEFLRRIYPAASKAANYLLSQRDDKGLISCKATGEQDWGIVGWRNVIPNYRLSGATTEVNSECYGALREMSQMARTLDKHEESKQFSDEAAKLKSAINTHLLDTNTGLYYLNIDLDGNPHTDVTSDLIFPVMFGVADEQTASTIVGRLAQEDFWTKGGIRTSPRTSPTYSPDAAAGLMGGVWVGVSFWYAFAAAGNAPELMARALSTTFRNYSEDPGRNNTVPGQFSEWLHGETLTNEGMMLSPWEPPRYLWAAVEGMAGLDLSEGSVRLIPRMAPDWKWMAAHNVPHRGRRLTWLAVRLSETTMYANFPCPGDSTPVVTYDQDITNSVEAVGETICSIGFRQTEKILLFAGNTADRTITTSIRLTCGLQGEYRLNVYNSLLNRWVEQDRRVSAGELERGIVVEIERRGFSLLDLRQEA